MPYNLPNNTTRSEDFLKVKDTLYGAKTREQLINAVRFVNIYIKKYDVRVTSPEYIWFKKSIWVKRSSLKSNGIDEGEEPNRRIIKNILKEFDDLSWMDGVSDVWIPGVGDIVTLKPGYNSHDDTHHNTRDGQYEIDDEWFGGGGYDDYNIGEEYKIRKISVLKDDVDYELSVKETASTDNMFISKQSGRSGWILWLEGGGGVWSDAVTPVLKESLNWEDKDESWSKDDNWSTDDNYGTDNSQWDKDANWVQGDSGGSDDGGSGDGGDDDYDSFMSEDDWGWADDVTPFRGGSFFDDDDICVNGECTDESVIIHDGNIVFTVDLNQWMDEFCENYDDGSWILGPLMRNHGVYDEFDRWDEIDDDEMNYIPGNLTPEVKSMLTTLLSRLTDGDPEKMIAHQGYGQFDSVSVKEFFEDTDIDVLNNYWEELSSDCLYAISESTQTNRWKSVGDYFRYITTGGGNDFNIPVEFELVDKDVIINMPTKDLNKFDGDDLTLVLGKITSLIDDVYWPDIYHDDWDSSGSEDDINRYFKHFITKSTKYLDENEELTINESDDLDWIRDVEPTIPITELGPNDKFKIVGYGEKFEDEMVADRDLRHLLGNIGEHTFTMDEKSIFTSQGPHASPYYENFNDIPNISSRDVDFWMIDPTGDRGGWITTDEVSVIKL